MILQRDPTELQLILFQEENYKTVIRNTANIGFSQHIGRYEQTLKIIIK